MSLALITLPRALRQAQQQGFSLVTVMIILVVVTLLGAGASQMVLLGERSARYDRDWQIAFQAAEAALLDAEFDIWGPNTSAAKRLSSFGSKKLVGFSDGCSTGADRGLCTPSVSGKAVWYRVDFTDESANARTAQFGEFTGRTLAFGNAGVQPAKRPRYIIEAVPVSMPGRPPELFYRVTAMGFGPRIETQVVLQMYFRKE